MGEHFEAHSCIRINVKYVPCFSSHHHIVQQLLVLIFHTQDNKKLSMFHHIHTSILHIDIEIVLKCNFPNTTSLKITNFYKFLNKLY